MKPAAKLLFLFFLTGTFAVAQIAQGTFKHIIIVVQENRTPDNLFGAGAGPQSSCGSEYDFQPGVDIDNGAPNKQQGQPHPTCNVSTPLANSCNPEHNHIDFSHMYDGGAMDGACSNTSSGCSGTCPQYAYVPQSDVLPYYEIAENYGFANYMFQSNEGPSFPAHQFLFAGTSAPVPYLDSSGHWTWFAAENPQPGQTAGDDTGCTAPAGQYVQLIDNSGHEGSCSSDSDPHCSVPCYERATANQQGQYTWGSLADLLGAQVPPVGWKYYTPAEYAVDDHETFENGLWVAPIAINHFCQPGLYNHVYQCVGLVAATMPPTCGSKPPRIPFP